MPLASIFEYIFFHPMCKKKNCITLYYITYCIFQIIAMVLKTVWPWIKFVDSLPIKSRNYVTKLKSQDIIISNIWLYCLLLAQQCVSFHAVVFVNPPRKIRNIRVLTILTFCSHSEKRNDSIKWNGPNVALPPSQWRARWD